MKLEKLLEAVPDALVGMDQEGVIRFVNRQTELLFGYDRDELIGQLVETLVPEPLWQIYAQNREQYFADPRTRSSGLEVELSGRHHNGGEFPINISMSHIDTGDVLLVITGAADVARQQQAVKNAGLTGAIVEYSDDAIIGGTLKGIITGWNPAAERMYGYSSKEILGKSGSLLFPEDRVGELNAVMEQVKAGQIVRHLESTRVRKDATLVRVSITIAPIRDGEGAVVGVSAVHRDVTEQRQAFEAAQRMAAIVESSDDAIIASTLEGTITSWNPAAERMYGYSSKEIVGRSIQLVVPKDRSDEVSDILEQLKVVRHVAQLETEHVRKDGSVFPVSLSVSPVRDAGGMIIGTSVISRDLTEQVQAQRALAKSEERYRLVAENAADVVVQMSPDGVTTWVSPSVTGILGWRPEEIVGLSWFDFIHPEEVAAVRETVARAAAGESVSGRTRLRHADGSYRWVARTWRPITDDAGAVVVLIAGFHDVQAVVDAEQALAKSEEHYRLLAQNASDIVVLSHPDGAIEWVSPAVTRTLGWAPEDLIGTRLVDLVYPDEAFATAAQPKALYAGHEINAPEGGFVGRMRAKSGQYRWVSGSATPVANESGTYVGVVTGLRDVDDLVHEREAAEAARAHLRATVDSLLDPLVTISPEGKITDVNEATVKVTGVPRDELIGTAVSLYHTEPEKTDEIYQQVVAQGSLTDYPLTLRHRDGTLTDVLCNFSVYRDTGGNVLGVCAAARDVTKQKETFEAAQRMAAIVEYSDDAIIGRTIDGVITSWNPAAERMFGYSSQEIVGKPIDLLSPEDRGGDAISILAKISAGRPVKNFETLHVRKNGSAFTVSLTISPIRDEKGAVVSASVICRDVTELKHAALYARSLIEAALDPLVTISPEGRITDVNEATVKVTGVPRNKLIGTDFSGYFTDPDEAHEGYQRVFAQGSVTDYPLTLRHRDGTLTDVLYNASVYRDARGNVLGVFAAAREITKQKEAFEAAQRMAAIVEYSDDAIVGSTLEGIITNWNPAAERMYGYSSEKIVGRSIDLLSPKDRTGEIKAILAKIKAGRPGDNFETICTRKDRTTFPVKLNIAPIRDADGAVVGASAIARDVTEQK
jgi:PAS domain S-box-containing protein